MGKSNERLYLPTFIKVGLLSLPLYRIRGPILSWEVSLCVQL